MRIGGGRRSSNVEDRRGQSTRTAGVSSAALLPLARVLFSKAGRRFLVPVAVIAIAAFVFFPKQTSAILGALLGSGGSVQSAERLPEAEEQAMFEFSSAVLKTTEEVWDAIYRAQGQNYAEPNMVIYTGGTSTACGFGQAAMGPFYCPADQKVYIDLTFFKQMETRMNAGGDFAQAYVIAHEVGHHIQNLTGVLQWSHQQKTEHGMRSPEANQVQVRVELMADCYAGVWANRSQRLDQVALERGDLEEAVAAAEAVGDDTLQRKATGRVVPDSFTHGSSAQRVRWFRKGFDGGDPDQCETRFLPYSQL